MIDILDTLKVIRVRGMRRGSIENTLSDIRIVRFSVNMTDYDPSNP